MALRQTAKYYDFRGNRITSEPTVEPVTWAELLVQTREVADNLQAVEAYPLIKQAREWIEEITGLAFITQSWKLTLDRWPGYYEQWWDGVVQMATTELTTNARAKAVYFPRYPLQTVDSVKTYDESGNLITTTVADVFDVDTNSRRGRMTLKFGQTWPITGQSNNAVEIAYTVGYGDAASNVPEILKRAILQLAAYMYGHRGDGCTPEEAYFKSGAKGIAERFAVRSI